MSLFYRFELIGGPFDGSKGMAWVDDGEHPVPGRIYVGRCVEGSCGDESCPGRAHVWYWLERDAAGEHAVKYLKADTQPLLAPDLWLARFVHSEVSAGAFRGDEAEERELVHASGGGHEEGVPYGRDDRARAL